MSSTIKALVYVVLLLSFACGRPLVAQSTFSPCDFGDFETLSRAGDDQELERQRVFNASYAVSYYLGTVLSLERISIEFPVVRQDANDLLRLWRERYESGFQVLQEHQVTKNRRVLNHLRREMDEGRDEDTAEKRKKLQMLEVLADPEQMKDALRREIASGEMTEASAKAGLETIEQRLAGKLDPRAHAFLYYADPEHQECNLCEVDDELVQSASLPLNNARRAVFTIPLSWKIEENQPTYFVARDGVGLGDDTLGVAVIPSSELNFDKIRAAVKEQKDGEWRKVGEGEATMGHHKVFWRSRSRESGRDRVPVGPHFKQEEWTAFIPINDAVIQMTFARSVAKYELQPEDEIHEDMMNARPLFEELVKRIRIEPVEHTTPDE